MALNAEAVRYANAMSHGHAGRIEGGRHRGTPMRCLCKCGAVFEDIPGGPDADSQWHMHCTEMEITAYFERLRQLGDPCPTCGATQHPSWDPDLINP